MPFPSLWGSLVLGRSNLSPRSSDTVDRRRGGCVTVVAALLALSAFALGAGARWAWLELSERHPSATAAPLKPLPQPAVGQGDREPS